MVAGISADKLNCWNFEMNEDVRIIYPECCYANGIITSYEWGCCRCSSHSLRGEGEEALEFFYRSKKKTLTEY